MRQRVETPSFKEFAFLIFVLMLDKRHHDLERSTLLNHDCRISKWRLIFKIMLDRWRRIINSGVVFDTSFGRDVVRILVTKVVNHRVVVDEFYREIFQLSSIWKHNVHRLTFFLLQSFTSFQRSRLRFKILRFSTNTSSSSELANLSINWRFFSLTLNHIGIFSFAF